MKDFLDTEAELAQLINATGKLRMLSHQVVMLLLLRQSAPEDDLVAARLRPALEDFAGIAATLQSPDTAPGLGPDAAAALAAQRAITPGALHHIQRFLDFVHHLINQPNDADISKLARHVAGDLLNALNATITGIQAALNAQAQQHQEAQAPLQRAVENSVAEVTKLTKSLQIVSTNASIEAERVGTMGAAFRTIATEMRDLSQKSRGSLDRLTEDLQAFRAS